MSYRIEISRIQVTLVSTRGGRQRVDVFLRVKHAHAHERESLGDRLNDPETLFIPLEIEERMELFAISSITYIEVSRELPEVDRIASLGGWREPATVVLNDGHALEGDLVYLLPHGRQRVSDLLNHGRQFILLYDGECSRYINRDAITRVRTGLDDQLPESHA